MGRAEYALGIHCGVTFAGLKAAGLFALEENEPEGLESCMRCFRGRGFVCMVVRRGGRKALVYIYHRKMPETILFDLSNMLFLRANGYNYSTVEEGVEELKERLQGAEFPHEIGVFLGYPLEDVEGFMASPQKGVQVIGCWKVYSNAEEKIKLFERFHRCSEDIRQKLLRGERLASIFKVV